MAPSCPLLGPPRGVLGLICAYLGSFLAPCWASLGLSGPIRAYHFEADITGVNRGARDNRRVELIFRPQGNAISLLPKLVGILVLRGALLAPSWLLLGRLGGSWGLSAPIWAPSWPLAGRLWASLGLSAPILSSRKFRGLIVVFSLLL